MTGANTHQFRRRIITFYSLILSRHMPVPRPPRRIRLVPVSSFPSNSRIWPEYRTILFPCSIRSQMVVESTSFRRVVSALPITRRLAPSTGMTSTSILTDGPS
jgi:hypothetical protein